MQFNAAEAKRVSDSFSASKIGYYQLKGIALLEEQIKRECELGGFRLPFDTKDLLTPEDYGAVHSSRLSILIKEALISELTEAGYRITPGFTLNQSDFIIFWD